MKLLKFTSSIVVFLAINLVAFTQTQSDTLYAYITHEAVVVDGVASEACWDSAEWHPIENVWIPYNAKMKDGDFEGKFKLAWDSSYLYLLVEVLDDSLSDDHENPLQNWWDDDCVEIFIDEDRSKGWHEKSNNAFAYHVSMFYDAIDMNTSGAGVNYKDHMQVVMDTIAEDTYLWEFAIKIYDDTFNASNAGSMYMSSATANDNYKTANYFGSLLLVDPDFVDNTSASYEIAEKNISVYPNPVSDELTISLNKQSHEIVKMKLINVAGDVVWEKSSFVESQNIDMSNFKSGMYFLSINTEKLNAVKKIIKK